MKARAVKMENSLRKHAVSLRTLFPTLEFDSVVAPDMSEGSSFFGMDSNHDDLYESELRLIDFQQQHPGALLANGYLERRSFYNTPDFARSTNGHTEYRNIHLGTDFWVAAGTPVHAPLNGQVVIAHNNAGHKDYGPTLVLRHLLEDIEFYSLYGHLSVDSLVISPVGKQIRQGEQIGSIGTETVNGHWLPHLHLQLITDLLGNTQNYNGVAFESELEEWSARCPNPNLLFTEELPSPASSR